ncbi:hypothetical protein B0H19DRAFT_387663 [Mycena capillaripes]|nr:hypothetical protein B0H19DRAFT_387663 [Mycena capillaripes]
MPSLPPSPSPSSSPSSTSKAPTSPIVPISIAVIAVVFLAFAMLLTFHFRRQNKKKLSAAQARKGREVRAGETVSRAHPAALMITPEDGKGTPRFVHTPGTNMRIATRRADGAWEFEDPRGPFTPAIIADASETASRNSSVPSVAGSDSSSDPRDPLRSRALNSPYSQASYETPVPGSSSQLLPLPTTTTVATPWGAPTTPRTADSDISGRSPWRSLHSPTPSTSAFLPAPSIAASSRRSSTISSNDSFLELEPSGASTYSNPFRSPASTAPSRGARWPASPAASVRASPEPPATPAARARDTESRAAREIRQDIDHSSAYAEQSGTAHAASVSPEPPMTPAARAKEAESAAARAIRRGYERVDRMSEYAEDEDLPSY